MIPHTYPTIGDDMVVGVLTDVTGLNEWQDYLPVQANDGAIPAGKNTYANDGYRSVNVLEDLTGKNVWQDYVPVYIVADRTGLASVGPNGYLSFYPAVGALGGGSGEVLFQAQWNHPWAGIGASPYVEESPVGNTAIWAGNNLISSEIEKEGTGGLISGNRFGNGATYFNDSTGNDFDLEDQDFTIEYWWRSAGGYTTPTAHIAHTNGAESGADSGWRLGRNANGLIWSFGTDATTTVVHEFDATTYTTGVYRHIALVRSGDTLTLYEDGVAHTNTYTHTTGFTYRNPAAPLICGTDWNGAYMANSSSNGYFDLHRVTKGAALYTETFTPNGTGFD